MPKRVLLRARSGRADGLGRDDLYLRGSSGLSSADHRDRGVVRRPGQTAVQPGATISASPVVTSTTEIPCSPP